MLQRYLHQLVTAVAGVGVVIVALAVAHASPQSSGQIVMPPVVAPLTKPDAEGQKPRAVAMLAPYHYDDILWENDRTAHRICGHALEAAEPPSSSGIDAWGKNVRWPYMDRQLKSGSQHDFHGEGLDFYDVNTTRGAGGLGIWFDNNAAWDKGLDFHDRARWEAYVREQQPDFDPGRK